MGRQEKEVKSYNDIRTSLNTGDIVLFSGSGVISKTIQYFSRSFWSHIGMVIRDEEWKMLLLWESTTLSKVKDVESRGQRQGVAIRPMSDRLRDYPVGKVAFRKLQNITITDEMKQVLIAFRDEIKGRNYEESKIELMKSAYDGFLGDNKEDLSSVFCSELVAEALQRIGVLKEYDEDGGYPSNEYTPADFGKDDIMGIKQGSFGELVYV